MHNVSTAYKRAMDKPIRGVGYIQVGLGVISLEAQASANVDDNTLSYWSNPSNLFNNNKPSGEYATLEENFMKADGSLLCMPREYNIKNVGIATEGINGAIKIAFDAVYSIKGLTLDFGAVYPEEFKVITANEEFIFSNNSAVFQTTQNFGDTPYIIIRPTVMQAQRLRLKSAVMGIALTFGNDEVSDSNYSEFISPISEEVSSSSFDVTIIDNENIYNVDSDDSFINFLEAGQNVSVVMGATLENGDIEWVNVCNLSLDSWSSSKGQFQFSAVDKFANQDDKYTLGNRIYDRSAYTEIQNILEDMGLTADQYSIENYLSAVTLHNPIPEASHKECLQMIANACRCVVYQDYSGKICVRTNFALVLDAEDVVVDTYGTKTEWSNPENILAGSHYVYSDFTKDFFRADGTQSILPTTDDYLDTGYISNEVADGSGLFKNNPKISLAFENASSYYGLHVKFDGNAPEEMIIRTYLDDRKVSERTYRELDNDTYISYEFTRFNKIEFEFAKATPYNRVLINKIAFGDFNDYKLKFNDMKEEPYGAKERPIKSISVKIFTYENKTDKDGNIKPEEVKDDVWYYSEMGSVGENLEVENPLIHNAEMAQTLCEWLENYYRNNVEYSVDYRGDARLNANDIIHMESRAINNLQVAIIENNLKFNGAWSGSLTMRKALRKGEE